MASLRNMRSCMNRLIKGTCTATANGFGLKSDSASPLQPLLPLTVPRQGSTGNQARLKMKSGKPASLLLVALMILASATVLPLPGLEDHSDTAATVLKGDVSSSDQSVLSGEDPCFPTLPSQINQQLTPFSLHSKSSVIISKLGTLVRMTS